MRKAINYLEICALAAKAAEVELVDARLSLVHDEMHVIVRKPGYMNASFMVDGDVIFVGRCDERAAVDLLAREMHKAVEA